MSRKGRRLGGYFLFWAVIEDQVPNQHQENANEGGLKFETIRDGSKGRNRLMES
jgi:hypothetical protein